MPLRDHFRAPASRLASWESVQGQWPAMIVLALNRWLPQRYVAHPRVHLGSAADIDVSTYEKDEGGLANAGNGNGGVATAIWAPPRPTLAVATDLPAQDDYAVRVYDNDRGQRLVAAIELVSPANKDRPENRNAFAVKCVALLQEQVSVTIVDLVTNRTENHYAKLLDLIGQSDPVLEDDPPVIYAVTSRATKKERPGASWELECWLQLLNVGERLPTLPLCLADNYSVPLDLELSYEDTCKALRIT